MRPVRKSHIGMTLERKSQRLKSPHQKNCSHASSRRASSTLRSRECVSESSQNPRNSSNIVRLKCVQDSVAVGSARSREPCEPNQTASRTEPIRRLCGFTARAVAPMPNRASGSRDGCAWTDTTARATSACPPTTIPLDTMAARRGRVKHTAKKRAPRPDVIQYDNGAAQIQFSLGKSFFPLFYNISLMLAIL